MYHTMLPKKFSSYLASHFGVYQICNLQPQSYFYKQPNCFFRPFVPGGARDPNKPQILANQLTISQPRGRGGRLCPPNDKAPSDGPVLGPLKFGIFSTKLKDCIKCVTTGCLIVMYIK